MRSATRTGKGAKQTAIDPAQRQYTAGGYVLRASDQGASARLMPSSATLSRPETADDRRRRAEARITRLQPLLAECDAFLESEGEQD